MQAQVIPRNPNGTFQKGYRGPGKQKGTRDFKTELIEGLRAVEKSKRQSAMMRAWEMAWDDGSVMAALLRKLIPDLSHQTGQQPVSIQIIYGHNAPARTVITHPLPDDGPNGH